MRGFCDVTPTHKLAPCRLNPEKPENYWKCSNWEAFIGDWFSLRIRSFCVGVTFEKLLKLFRKKIWTLPMKSAANKIGDEQRTCIFNLTIKISIWPREPTPGQNCKPQRGRFEINKVQISDNLALVYKNVAIKWNNEIFPRRFIWFKPYSFRPVSKFRTC